MRSPKAFLSRTNALLAHAFAAPRRHAHATPLAHRREAGFTLLEVLVTIAVMAMMIAVFAAVTVTTTFLRKSGYSIQAANFVREEIDALRALPYDELLDREDGNFLGISLTRGGWRVAVVPDAPSAPNALWLSSNPTHQLVGESGLAVVPSNYHKDFDFSSAFRVDDASPSGWEAGIAFHYRDSENHYRYRFSATEVALDRVYHGSVSTLWSQSSSFSTDTWYTLRVAMTGSSISLYKDGSLLTTTSDSTFEKGDIGLQSLNDALIAVDDITIDEYSVTTVHDFDDVDVGPMPTTWHRFVYEDLPEGVGTVTIEDYNGLPGLKHVVVTVTWLEESYEKSLTGSTLIAE